MNISQNTTSTKNIITSYDSKSITIGECSFSSTFIANVSTTEVLELESILEINAEQIAKIISYEPEIIIFGTGKKLIKPNFKKISTIIDLKISFEYMQTTSAVKTYNSLVFDERNVLGLFILDES
ncbi:MAG: MTH938/NDUFAF3 family protein [Pseudomonadota bacterium]|nr:MTH938/NDUFAF3 family protein [Pseudomonadota bacterium]